MTRTTPGAYERGNSPLRVHNLNAPSLTKKRHRKRAVPGVFLGGIYPVIPIGLRTPQWHTAGMSNRSTIARGDLRAYEESVRLPTPELVERLRDLLGAKLVAYLGSVQETRAVRQWADSADARTPSTEVVNRLRMAYRIAALLREKDSAAVVQTWFQGMNPRLDDVAPARLLREGDLEQVGPEVLAAARAFAAAG